MTGAIFFFVKVFKVMSGSLNYKRNLLIFPQASKGRNVQAYKKAEKRKGGRERDTERKTERYRERERERDKQVFKQSHAIPIHLLAVMKIQYPR